MSGPTPRRKRSIAKRIVARSLRSWSRLDLVSEDPRKPITFGTTAPVLHLVREVSAESTDAWTRQKLLVDLRGRPCLLGKSRWLEKRVLGQVRPAPSRQHHPVL